MSACHRIGGCSFCPLRSNGGTWGAAFGTASGAGTSGSWRAPITASTIFVTDGIWHRQVEPRPTWCRASRHDISCDKRRPRLSPQLQPDMAQGTIMTDGIYNYQYDCPYTEAMADVGKKLSTLFSIGEKSGQLRPYVRPVDANFVAGHHGCSLTCQAPIC